MRLGERNLFVPTLTAEGEGVRGSFDRPAQFSSTKGVFSGMRGSVRHDRVVRSRFANGVLHLTIRNANDAQDEDSYAMVVKGDRAELTYVFDRPPGGATVVVDWEPNRVYAPGDSDAASTEMRPSSMRTNAYVRIGISTGSR